MTNSILRGVIIGVVLGAMFYFVPGLVLGIFVIVLIVHLLRFAFMGHGYYGRGYYGHGRCGYGPGYGYRHDCCEGNGYHDECEGGPYGHHHGHGGMHGHLFHWADKIRNMSEEEYTEFKNKMDKGFGYWGRHCDDYQKYRNGGNNAGENDKKEETTK